LEPLSQRFAEEAAPHATIIAWPIQDYSTNIYSEEIHLLLPIS